MKAIIYIQCVSFYFSDFHELTQAVIMLKECFSFVSDSKCNLWFIFSIGEAASDFDNKGIKVSVVPKPSNLLCIVIRHDAETQYTPGCSLHRVDCRFQPPSDCLLGGKNAPFAQALFGQCTFVSFLFPIFWWTLMRRDLGLGTDVILLTRWQSIISLIILVSLQLCSFSICDYNKCILWLMMFHKYI